MKASRKASPAARRTPGPIRRSTEMRSATTRTSAKRSGTRPPWRAASAAGRSVERGHLGLEVERLDRALVEVGALEHVQCAERLLKADRQHRLPRREHRLRRRRYTFGRGAVRADYGHNLAREVDAKDVANGAALRRQKVRRMPGNSTI